MTYFVEIEDQIQLADIVEVFVEDFDEIVNGLQVHQVVVVDVYADAKVQACVATVDNLEVAELTKTRRE